MGNFRLAAALLLHGRASVFQAASANGSGWRLAAGSHIPELAIADTRDGSSKTRMARAIELAQLLNKGHSVTVRLQRAAEQRTSPASDKL